MELLQGSCDSAGVLQEIGPVKCLLAQVAFDEVHLLSNFSTEVNRRYGEWLGIKHESHAVALADPTDYSEVFRVVDFTVASAVSTRPKNETEFCVHLSPGTPTMAAIWLLLGKSKYHPATFYQTHKGRAWTTDIPFDLIIDFVPQVMRDADARFQALASHSPQDVRGFEGIIGNSHSLRVAVGQARRAAIRDVAVLLLGESGTGKEKFARAIHDASPRRDKRFIAINCAAISKELLESELFGHKKGAFTGAADHRDGAFKEADGGTLFLDEIGECDPAMQAKLLRVLQTDDRSPGRRTFYRVGDSKPQTSDVRVIAATNRDLVLAVSRGEFRDDLYYRVAAITIKLPPLRARRQDIPALAAHLLQQINQTFAKQEPGYEYKYLSGSAVQFVQSHQWPGNVRQLFNTLLQAAVMTDGDVIDKADLSGAVADAPGLTTGSLADQPLGDGFVLTEFLEEIQRQYLARAMQEAHGVKSKAAQLLGYKNYQTMAAQLQRLAVSS